MNETDFWLLARQFGFAIPLLLVCFAGLIVAILFIKKYFWSSVLTLAAMCILFVIRVTMPLAQLYLLHASIDRGWTTVTQVQVLTVISLTTGFGDAAAAILLLIAVFAGRKSASATKAAWC
jgi:hypothetical protein